MVPWPPLFGCLVLTWVLFGAALKRIDGERTQPGRCYCNQVLETLALEGIGAIVL